MRIAQRYTTSDVTLHNEFRKVQSQEQEHNFENIFLCLKYIARSH